MTDLPLGHNSARVPLGGWAARINRLIATPRFQSWAARFPLTRRIVRRDGEALFDLVAGFCHSQILCALVDLRIPEALIDGPRSARTLGALADIPEARMRILLRAGVALGLMRLRRKDDFSLTRRGAALCGVPGLRQMILHHAVLYRDLADPVAFFRDGANTELAAFWPYVFGAGAAADPVRARVYSELMADSQALVAEDTLAAVSLAKCRHLLDVGGGTGTFLAACCRAYPALTATLFDLPDVVLPASPRLAAVGLANRIQCAPGSFRDDLLPTGADTISLVRVLYDHDDATVAGLLTKVLKALPPGGRLIVSEPMTGGLAPERAGDAYFALYTLAMGTGCARSATRIAELCAAAGFTAITTHTARRPFVTSVVTARRPRDSERNMST